jgi:hypothetical protein
MQGSPYTVLFTGASDRGTFHVAGTSRSGRYLYGSQSGIAILELLYDQNSNGASSPDNDYLQLNLGGGTFQGIRKIGNDSATVTGTFSVQ